MRSAAAIVMILLSLVAWSSRRIEAQTATLDAIDIQDLGGELLAIRGGSAPSRIRLESGEKAVRFAAEGIVGVALTDRRFLAVSPASAGWQQARLRPSDGSSPEVQLAAKVALLVCPKRILGFDGASGLLSETRLTPQEAPLASKANEHVGVVVTNRRVIGLASGFGAPVDASFTVHESFESLRVLSTAASVRTSDRVLIFNSSTGSWRDEARPLD